MNCRTATYRIGDGFNNIEATSKASTTMNQNLRNPADRGPIGVGTTAIVTGASRGFGRAVAAALTAAGAHVVGVARTAR